MVATSLLGLWEVWGANLVAPYNRCRHLPVPSMWEYSEGAV